MKWQCKIRFIATGVALALGLSACGDDPGARDGGGDASDDGPPIDCVLPRQLIESPYRLRFDQLGYLDGTEKWALLVSPGLPPAGYRVYSLAAQCFVVGGTAGPRLLDTTSRAGSRLVGDRIDFAALLPGTYLVVLDDGTRFGPFAIGPDVYAPVLPLLTTFFAVQRCGPTVAASQHAACHAFASVASAHSGDGVAVDDGTSGYVTRATGPAVDVEGGWHDAGDYLKFVGTTAYVLAVDLYALRDHPAAFGASGVALAAELRVGLDWLLKMLGGSEPYHQVGGPGDHAAAPRRPEADTVTPIAAYDQRPLYRMATGAGRNLLGRAAAAFALGSQVYAADSAYAAKLLAQAKASYAAARSRPSVQASDPPSFYPESSADDDLVLGAAALARATSDPSYAADAHTFGVQLASPAGAPLAWDGVDALALLEAARAQATGSPEAGDLRQKLAALAAPIAQAAAVPTGPGAAFGYALPSFGNGSIAEALGAAATCLAARRISATAGCDELARRQLHWLLGQNPFGVAFLVGAGSAPANLHHSLAQAAQLTLPGAIPGGPTSTRVLAQAGLPLPPKSDPYAMWSTDDLLYEDLASDFVTNEPALDYGAALVFVLGELLDP